MERTEEGEHSATTIKSEISNISIVAALLLLLLINDQGQSLSSFRTLVTYTYEIGTVTKLKRIMRITFYFGRVLPSHLDPAQTRMSRFGFCPWNTSAAVRPPSSRQRPTSANRVTNISRLNAIQVIAVQSLELESKVRNLNLK